MNTPRATHDTRHDPTIRRISLERLACGIPDWKGMMSIRCRSAVLVAAMALAGVSGCGDDPTSVQPDPTFTGMWGGVPWQGEATTSRGMSDDTLYVFGSSPVGGKYSTSVVTIRVPFEGSGTYTLGPGDGTLTQLVGGDGVVSTHGTMTDGAGILIIVEHADGRIAGSVNFAARDVRDQSPDAEIIRFEGSFEGTLPD